MNRLFAAVLLCLVVAFHSYTGVAAQPKWQHTDIVVEGPSLNNPAETGGIAIYSREQSIIIITDRRVEVRVFTILGQLVSRGDVLPGTSVLNINSRGIYIVKIENMTQKVAL